MTVLFSCNCSDKTFNVRLMEAWECWRVHPKTGELLNLVESGNSQWEDACCSKCDAKVTLDD